METKALIEAAVPRGAASIVADYAIAPADADSSTIGVFACFEQCVHAQDLELCIAGAANVDARLIVYHLIDCGVSPDDALEGAAFGGQIDLIKELIARGARVSERSLAAAATCSLDAMASIISVGIDESMVGEAFNDACGMNAPIICMEWLMDLGATSRCNLIAACENMRDDAVLSLIVRGAIWPSAYNPLDITAISTAIITPMVTASLWTPTMGFELACRNASIEIMRAMIGLGAEVTPAGAELAAKANCVPAVDFILERNPDLLGLVMVGAALGNHVSMLDHIEALSGPIGQSQTHDDYTYTLPGPAKLGHVEAVEWLVARGGSLTDALKYASQAGASVVVRRLIPSQHKARFRRQLFRIACHYAKRHNDNSSVNWPCDYRGVFDILYQYGVTRCNECGRSAEAHLSVK